MGIDWYSGHRMVSARREELQSLRVPQRMTGSHTQTDCTPGLDHGRELVRCPGDHGAPSALKRLMVENREDLCDGLKKDLGKSELEGWLTAKPLPRSPAIPRNPRRPPRDPQDPRRPMGTLKISRSGVVHGKRSKFFPVGLLSDDPKSYPVPLGAWGRSATWWRRRCSSSRTTSRGGSSRSPRPPTS